MTTSVLITPARFAAGSLDTDFRYFRIVPSSPLAYLPFGPHLDVSSNAGIRFVVGPMVGDFMYTGSFTGPTSYGVSK